MPAGSVRVEGLRELNRDLGKFAKDVQKQLQKELRAVAEPVAADIRGRLGGLNARTVAGVRAGSRSGAAVVRQRAGKTTGQRPDFGVLQMQRGFLPALQEAGPATLLRLEAMLDRLARTFNA